MSESLQPSDRRLISGAAVLVGFLVLVYLMCAPNFIGGGTSKTNGIINNLRQLDGAKQQWALEHHRTGAVQVVEADVSEYLRVHNGWVQPVAREKYHLNLLTESPEAELTRSVDGRPKGTRILLLPAGREFSVSPQNVTNWGSEIILPNNATAPRR